MGNSVELSPLEAFFRSIIQKYNHKKYWKYRSIVVDPSRGSKIGDLFRLYYIKRADTFHNASMGTHRNFGASFAEAPQLPHGLNGIIVSHNAVIGSSGNNWRRTQWCANNRRPCSNWCRNEDCRKGNSWQLRKNRSRLRDHAGYSRACPCISWRTKHHPEGAFNQ